MIKYFSYRLGNRKYSLGHAFEIDYKVISPEGLTALCGVEYDRQIVSNTPNAPFCSFCVDVVEKIVFAGREDELHVDANGNIRGHIYISPQIPSIFNPPSNMLEIYNDN